MSNITTTPLTTQQQRIFSASSFWYRQAISRQQRINEHLAKLEQEKPANAIGVHVVLNFPTGKIEKTMTWEEYKRECWNDYVVFKGWEMPANEEEGITGGKPSKTRIHCDNTLDRLNDDDDWVNATHGLSVDEMEHEMFAQEQLNKQMVALGYTDRARQYQGDAGIFVPRETLAEVM